MLQGYVVWAAEKGRVSTLDPGPSLRYRLSGMTTFAARVKASQQLFVCKPYVIPAMA